MAVKAEFSADTSSFVKEVTKADAALKTFGTSAGTVQKQVGAFDSVLSKAGINVQPTAKALDEIIAASGKSVAALGAFNVVALVVGTAISAWEFGRAIAGFFKLDEAISAATASAFGWGDVAAEGAFAQQDTINAAIDRGANVMISYTDAIKFNTEFHKKRLDVLKETADADAKQAAALKELHTLGNDYAATLAKMDVYTIEEIKHYLEMGVSQGLLATAFGVTASQVKAVEASMKAADAADKAWLEGMQAAAAEAALYASVLTGTLQKAITDTAAVDAKATAQLTAQTDARTTSILAEQAARDTIAAKYLPQVDATTAAWTRMQQQLEALQKEKLGDIEISARQQLIYDEYLDTGLKVAQAADQMAAGHDRTAAATTRATQAAGVYMNQLQMLVDDPKLAAFFGSDAKGAVATTLYSGGQGGLTPEMAAAMAAGQFINSAGVGAVHNTFNVNGTAQDVARTISAEIMRTMKAGGKMASG